MPRVEHAPFFSDRRPRTQGAARAASRALLPWFEDSTAETLPVGVAPVVTWIPETRTAALWVVGPRTRLRDAGLLAMIRPGDPPGGVGPTTRTTLAELLQGLPAWLPGVWGLRFPKVEDLVLLPVDAVRLDAETLTPLPSATVTWQPVVHGASLHAACVLAAASCVADAPVAPTLLVSAELRGVGQDCLAVGVEHTAEKRAGLAALAPRLTDVRMWPTRPEAACTLDTLLRAAGLHEPLRVGPPGTCEDRITALEDVVGVSGRALGDWGGVARAASTVLEDAQLPTAQRTRARFVRAVAQRHAGERAEDMPTLPELVEVGQPERLLMHLAHLVQHETDRGRSIEPALAELVRERTDDVERLDRPCWPAAIRLYGAWARNHATAWSRPALEEALRRSMVACAAWTLHAVEDELSYPLSEAFRLAGALGDEDAFRRCERVHARWVARTAASFGHAYVAVSRARARVLLAEASPGDGALRLAAAGALAALLDGASPSANLVDVARRWRRRLEGADHPAPADAEQAALTALDDAVLGRGGDAYAALDAVRARANWAAGMPLDVEPSWVARASPY